MIPLCLTIGDNTALGTAYALVAQGIRCAVHACIGAPSAESVRTFQSGSAANRVLIALGSNDPTNPRLSRNLTIVRRKTIGSRVTWLAPYHAGAARIVTEIARAYGDPVIQLSQSQVAIAYILTTTGRLQLPSVADPGNGPLATSRRSIAPDTAA